MLNRYAWPLTAAIVAVSVVLGLELLYLVFAVVAALSWREGVSALFPKIVAMACLMLVVLVLRGLNSEASSAAAVVVYTLFSLIIYSVRYRAKRSV